MLLYSYSDDFLPEVCFLAVLDSGPANISLEWKGATSNFPTNVNYTISFDDGNNNLTGAWKTNPKQLIKRPFTKPGKFDGIVYLQNYASGMNKTAKVSSSSWKGNWSNF